MNLGKLRSSVLTLLSVVLLVPLAPRMHDMWLLNRATLSALSGVAVLDAPAIADLRETGTIREGSPVNSLADQHFSNSLAILDRLVNVKGNSGLHAWLRYRVRGALGLSTETAPGQRNPKDLLIELLVRGETSAREIGKGCADGRVCLDLAGRLDRRGYHAQATALLVGLLARQTSGGASRADVVIALRSVLPHPGQTHAQLASNCGVLFSYRDIDSVAEGLHLDAWADILAMCSEAASVDPRSALAQQLPAALDLARRACEVADPTRYRRYVLALALSIAGDRLGAQSVALDALGLTREGFTRLGPDEMLETRLRELLASSPAGENEH